ncbi:ATP-binding protein [Leptolyngbya sp. GB1-A1]|uniref:ATP-binding protein n=1 Tax=Leptolyngbya sp. GB1-A1 TaxID=2933908 RepID=UPI00329759DC
MNRHRTSPFPKFGEMGTRMQAMEWAQTPVGAVESWSQSLKSTVRTLLGSRYPMILLWEQELIQIYNDAYINLIGTKHPYALGRSIRETQAESWDVIGPMITEVMTTGVPNWVEDQMLAVNRSGYNEEAHFSLSYSAVEDDAGTIRGMLCVCSEVTQQVLGERRLRLQRDLAAQAGETRSVDATCQDILATIADCLLDVPFALIYLSDFNDQTLKLCGSVGMNGNLAIVPTAVLLSESLAETADRWSLAKAMAGQTAIVSELDRDTTIPGGPWNESVSQAIALPIPSSNVAAPLGVLICGISPNRALDEGYQSFYELLAGQVSVSIRNAQAYEEERRRAEMLAEIDRAKTVFFSNVSHEFRTPLTLMLNPLEDLLQNDHLPAAEREQIAVAHRNSQRLLKLVNTLLDFSRLEAGRIQAVYEATDLASLTADLASGFRSAIEKAGLQLVVNCLPLPEPVYVDREMWEKIVLNLLSNAFKFTFEGQISVSLYPVDAAVELIVQDTGTGIPAHELPRLFERFHRVAGAQGRSYEGSGIGLSLVQELVKLHGGTVTASSVEKEGSTFVVRLPIGCAHLPSEQIQSVRTQASTASGATAYVEEALEWVVERREDSAALPPRVSARILLADDNADMRHYLQRLLREHYEVEAVADGQAALEAARAQLPDLVLTDVMMPRLDGFELLRQLRADPQTREIPILLLSARAGEEAAVEGLEAGADDYLVKPFSARELLARVATNLELGRSRRVANQQRFRFLAESIPQMVWTADAQGWVDYYSPRWFDYTGLTLAQTQGLGWQKIIHPDDRADSIRRWTQAAEQKTSYDVEHRLKRADGSYCWHLTRALPMLDEQGQVIRWFGTCTDITERKQAEKALKESTEQLSLALAAAKLGDWSWNAATDIVTLSGQAAEIFGIPPGPYMTWIQMQKLLHPDDRERAGLQVEKAIAGRSDYDIEYRVIHPDGTEQWIAAKGRAQYDSFGQVLGMMGVVQDITHRKQAETEREQLLARAQSASETLQRFIERTPAAVVMLDREMRYLFASDRWMSEYAPGYTNLKGLSHYEVITDIPERWQQVHQRCLAGATERCEEDCYLRSDGSMVWLHWEILPWYASGGEIGGIIIFAENITERKQAEQEREKLLEREQNARREAEQANRIKDEFLAVLSHELRSPLNPILGWAKLLQAHQFDEAATRRALETIERNAKLQTQLIDDLLDVSRILRGKLMLDVCPVNLVTVVDAALETVHLSAEAKGIEVQKVIASEIEPVSGDVARLQQVVWNLLSNAIKFTPSGGTVEIRLAQTNTHVQIQVQDTGKGIAPQFLPHVFEYFRQEDGTTTRKFGGLGLGLAIVQYLTELHGGTVQAESPGEGLGATFTVLLPASKSRRGENPGQPEPLSSSVKALPLAGFRVLAVDDQADMRELVLAILEQTGAEIKVTTSAIEALETLDVFKPDILVSDIGMPEMDGYELLRQIRSRSSEDNGDVLAIALTAYAGELNQQQALAAGFQGHIAKPVDPEKLVDVIISLMKEK